MRSRRLPTLLAATLGLLGVSCGSDSAVSDTTTVDDSVNPGSSSPVVVDNSDAADLDAVVLYFDPDGRDGSPGDPPLGRIGDTAGLEAFEFRHVDGEPPLPTAAREALVEGQILIGGVVSIGCFEAEGAHLELVGNDARLIADGVPDDDVDCVRAVTSVVLFAVDAADLPAGLTVQGS